MPHSIDCKHTSALYFSPLCPAGGAFETRLFNGASAEKISVLGLQQSNPPKLQLHSSIGEHALPLFTKMTDVPPQPLLSGIRSGSVQLQRCVMGGVQSVLALPQRLGLYGGSPRTKKSTVLQNWAASLSRWAKNPVNGPLKQLSIVKARLFEALKYTSQSLDLSQRDLKQLPPLEALPQLKKLNLQHNQLSGPSLAKLHHLPHLEDLNLSHNQISDQDLVHLRGLTSLKMLCLSNNKITDTGLSALKSLVELGYLLLDNNQISGNGLAALKPLSVLEFLDLGGNALTDDAMIGLQSFSELAVLGLAHNELTDAGLTHLAPLTHLVSLGLGYNQITGSSLPALKALEQLEELDLTHNPLSSDEQANLTALQHLKWLYVTDFDANVKKTLKAAVNVMVDSSEVTSTGALESSIELTQLIAQLNDRLLATSYHLLPPLRESDIWCQADDAPNSQPFLWALIQTINIPAQFIILFEFVMNAYSDLTVDVDSDQKMAAVFAFFSEVINHLEAETWADKHSEAYHSLCLLVRSTIQQASDQSVMAIPLHPTDHAVLMEKINFTLQYYWLTHRLSALEYIHWQPSNRADAQAQQMSQIEAMLGQLQLKQPEVPFKTIPDNPFRSAQQQTTQQRSARSHMVITQQQGNVRLLFGDKAHNDNPSAANASAQVVNRTDALPFRQHSAQDFIAYFHRVEEMAASSERFARDQAQLFNDIVREIDETQAETIDFTERELVGHQAVTAYLNALGALLESDESFSKNQASLAILMTEKLNQSAEQYCKQAEAVARAEASRRVVPGLLISATEPLEGSQGATDADDFLLDPIVHDDVSSVSGPDSYDSYDSYDSDRSSV